MAVVFKTLSATLAANVNEVTFTDAIINSNSVIEVYYNSNNVYTLETWQDGTTIGIVTSDHNFPVGVKVTINNVISFEPYDDTDLVNRIGENETAISGLADRVGTAEGDIDSLETRMGNAEDDIDVLESGKQDLLTAGDNITIEDNVISAIGGSVEYSFEERVVGKWVDGKPLYEKTVYIANPTNGSYYNHNVSNMKMGMVYCVTGLRNGVWFCGVFNSNGSDWLTILVYPGDTGGSNGLYSAFTMTSLKDLYITIRYTKTTD